MKTKGIRQSVIFQSPPEKVYKKLSTKRDSKFSRNLKLEKDKKIKLIITSDGPYRHRMEKHVEELGISSNVRFTGYMSRKKLNNYYLMSDTFVMGCLQSAQIRFFFLIFSSSSYSKIKSLFSR